MVLGALIVQRWFHLHRGLALGLLTASSATGQLLWRTKVALPLWAAPQCGGALVFASLGNGTLTQSADRPAGTAPQAPQ